MQQKRRRRRNKNKAASEEGAQHQPEAAQVARDAHQDGAKEQQTGDSAGPGPREPAVVVKISSEVVPFLIGIGGRNVALIGKHSGTYIKVLAVPGELESTVEIVPRRTASG